MKQRQLVWLTVLVLSLAAAAGCVSTPATPTPIPVQATATPPPTEIPAPAAGMPNPASVYCEEQGHSLEIRTQADGSQRGFCVFADGTECDEWAYFRGECGPGTPIAAAAPAVAPTVAPTTALPEPTPTPEPAAACTHITAAPGTAFEHWRTYTHETYGFSLLLPPSWVVEEITEPPHHTLRGHAIVLWSAEEPTARLQVAFRRQDEEQFIGRTGVGSGDIVEAGTACFVGQETARRALVFAGKDMTVLYGSGGEILRGDMAFTLYLDYRGGWEDPTALSKEIQALADQIIASLQLPGELG